MEIIIATLKAPRGHMTLQQHNTLIEHSIYGTPGAWQVCSLIWCYIHLSSTICTQNSGGKIQLFHIGSQPGTSYHRGSPSVVSHQTLGSLWSLAFQYTQFLQVETLDPNKTLMMHYKQIKKQVKCQILTYMWVETRLGV